MPDKKMPNKELAIIIFVLVGIGFGTYAIWGENGQPEWIGYTLGIIFALILGFILYRVVKKL